MNQSLKTLYLRQGLEKECVAGDAAPLLLLLLPLLLPLLIPLVIPLLTPLVFQLLIPLVLPLLFRCQVPTPTKCASGGRLAWLGIAPVKVGDMDVLAVVAELTIHYGKTISGGFPLVPNEGISAIMLAAGRSTHLYVVIQNLE
jgi:hypothetical protein